MTTDQQYISNIIQQTYHNSKDPGSFGGVERIYQSLRERGISGISRQKIKDVLQESSTYTLHKPARRKFKRNPTIVSGIDAQWQADLVDMNNISTHNDGYKYLLTVIDCFSKYAWAVPVKNKTSKSIVAAFEQIFNSKSPDRFRQPKKIQTDKGKEFLNAEFLRFLKDRGIAHFTTENVETKAAMVERFNRTLKTRMWAYFTHKRTRYYLDILDALVASYNNSTHRSISMKPNDVKAENEKAIFSKLYGNYFSRIANKRKEASPTVGSKIRISKVKTAFEKGYLPNWTGEVFSVKKELGHPPKRVYKIEDMLGEEIAGSFYPEEIQRVKSDPNTTLPVERIIKRKKVKGKNLVFVKFLDHPDKFNRWIKESDIKNSDDG